MSILSKLFKRGSNDDDASSRAPLERVLVPSASDLQTTLLEVSRLARTVSLPAALRVVDEALARSAEEPTLGFARAGTLEKWGRFREAAAAFRAARARAAYPDESVACQHGWAELSTGNLPQAAKCMRDAVAIEPTADAWYGLGYVQHLMSDIPAAVEALERSIALDPDNLRSVLVLATCELQRNRLVAAESLLRGGIARGMGAIAWVNLGVALERQDRIDEALAAYVEAERLEALSGESGGGLTNLAIAYSEAGDGAKALALFDRQSGIAKPYRQYIHGIALLRMGHLRRGWPLHEFRWACEPLVAQRAHLPIPMWNGQDLAGKAIVIRAEQGFGDTIQFIRYARWLKELGARVHVRVQVGLEKLAESFEGVDLVEVSSNPASADFYIHPMSLPRVFGTEVPTIPLGIPYVRVDAATSARWAARIAQGSRLRVGIAWAGSPEHKRDRLRSVSLAQLEPVLATPGVDFYSLQKGVARLQIQASPHGVRIVDLGPELEDFADTAAVMSRLDLVVCVDTSVAHLAGALGLPVWVLVSRPADFRWMQDRSDSPWYPSMRLFRQRERGRWDESIGRMAEALRQLESEARVEPTTSSAFHPLAPAPTPLAPLSQWSPGRSALAETRYGLLEYIPDQPIVGPSIAFYGECLQLQLEEVLRRCPQGSTVVQVGGGIGQDVLALSIQVGPTGHVILYEPDARLRTLLMQNMGLNQVDNVTALARMPLGTRAPFTADGACESIDDLRLGDLRWLIMSEEVSAPVALDGAADTLWRTRPSLLIRLRAADSGHAAAEKARFFGYACWLLETPLYPSGNFNRWNEDIFAGKTAFALVCAPEEAPFRAGSDWRPLA